MKVKAEKWRCRNKMEGKHNIEVKAERWRCRSKMDGKELKAERRR